MEINVELLIYFYKYKFLNVNLYLLMSFKVNHYENLMFIYKLFYLNHTIRTYLIKTC